MTYHGALAASPHWSSCDQNLPAQSLAAKPHRQVGYRVGLFDNNLFDPGCRVGEAGGSFGALGRHRSAEHYLARVRTRKRASEILLGLAVAPALVLGLLAFPGAAMTPAQSCAALNGVTVPAGEIGLPTSGARVTSTRMVGANASASAMAPAHCHVLGAIDPIDRQAPQIHFALELPVAWNGKAIMLGGGGFDGVIPNTEGPMLSLPPTVALSPLLRGYATFASNSGHQAIPGAAPSSSVDAAFAMNDEALANYAGDALKKTHDTAMRLIVRTYGRGPDRTYFAGGSNGGREALLVTQRWPQDFDGVIAAYPFWNGGTTALTFGYVMNGFAAPGAYPNPAKQALLYNAVMDACDGLDGLRDGLVSNVDACHFDPAVLRCPSGVDTGDTCLSDLQIAALRRYNSPVNYSYRDGEKSYPGFPVFEGADLRGSLPMGVTPPVHPATANMAVIAQFWDEFARFAIARDADFNALTLDPQHPGRFAAGIQRRGRHARRQFGGPESLSVQGRQTNHLPGLVRPGCQPPSNDCVLDSLKGRHGGRRC